MPLILALETATKLCSVALARDGVVLAVSELERDTHVHAEKLNVFIAEVMEKAGHTYADIDAVAVGIGPGSYTGLRIGLSAAKGLCFALDRPLIGVSTLVTLVESAMQVGLGDAQELWPMIDARRMEVFTQPYDRFGTSTGVVAPLIISTEWVDEGTTTRAVFGDGSDKATEFWNGRPNIIHVPNVRPTATALFAEAERRSAAGDFDDLAYLVPTYGKEANLSHPKKLRT